MEVALESEKWHWLRFCVEIFATPHASQTDDGDDDVNDHDDHNDGDGGDDASETDDDGQFVEFSNTNSITKKERNGVKEKQEWSEIDP